MNRSERYSAYSSQDADNEITMHCFCKGNVEHDRGPLLNDKGPSVAERSCQALCCSYATESFGSLICRLAIARILLVQVFRTLIPNATKHCYLLQSWLLSVLYIDHTFATSVRACNIMHRRLPVIPYDISKPAVSRNNLRHLICTGSWLAVRRM